MALPTASDNAFPSFLVTEGSAPSSPAAGKQRLFVDTSDHLLKLKNSGGTVTAVGSGGSGTLTTVEEVDGSPTDSAVTKIVVPNGWLAIASHIATISPLGGVIAYKIDTSGDHNGITATSAADVDATNAAVTFTAPASGNVLVRCSFLCSADRGGGSGGNVGDLIKIGLRESTSNIAGAGFIGHRLAVSGGTTNIYQPVSIPFYLTGVTAGSHTYKLSAFVSDGGRQRGFVGASADNQLVMEVVAL